VAKDWAINEANIFSQWDTSSVPTPDPTTEPSALVSGGDIVVHALLRRLSGYHTIKVFRVPILKTYTGERTIGEILESLRCAT
jgi:hypothetical protein